MVIRSLNKVRIKISHNEVGRKFSLILDDLQESGWIIDAPTDYLFLVLRVTFKEWCERLGLNYDELIIEEDKD